ncbi:MAG: phosphotransferase [Anaerolineales bacterium]|nr:phosphotransferase [Anaerolineales bacterium]
MGQDPLVWAYCYPDARRHEVICHNDFAPYNFVYRDDSPIAVIDFDLAGPGPRLRDIAYAAYWLAPLSFHSDDQKDFAAADLQAGSRRLKLFCAAYGIHANAELLDMIEEVLVYMGDEQQMIAVVGAAAATRLIAGGHLAHWQREAAAFRAQRASIEANLFTGCPLLEVKIKGEG